jgi:hypothetical protein
VLSRIAASSEKAVGQSAGDAGKLATDAVKNLGEGTEGVENAVKGIGDLFKKKE